MLIFFSVGPTKQAKGQNVNFLHKIASKTYFQSPGNTYFSPSTKILSPIHLFWEMLHRTLRLQWAYYCSFKQLLWVCFKCNTEMSCNSSKVLRIRQERRIKNNKSSGSAWKTIANCRLGFNLFLTTLYQHDDISNSVHVRPLFGKV